MENVWALEVHSFGSLHPDSDLAVWRFTEGNGHLSGNFCCSQGGAWASELASSKSQLPPLKCQHLRKLKGILLQPWKEIEASAEE